jgi:hypothetical protein
MWNTINEEPAYEVSDDGKVRRIKTKHVKSLRKGKAGYPRVTLYPSGKTHSVHRLVAKAFLINHNHCPSVNHKTVTGWGILTASRAGLSK